jgi:CHAT domain-containing protein
VKGDIEPSGVLRRLAIWFTDAFYAGDHDLVVDSLSMEGGLARTTPARVFFDQGYDVDHFSYFRNGRTAERVVAGLLREQNDQAGFMALAAATSTRGRPVLGAREAGLRPVVFVLPAVTGSHLKVGSSRIWIDLLGLAAGGLKRLEIERPDVVVDEPIWSYYADLCTFLDRSHEVRPWGYDWRRPIEDTAAAFADVLEETLSRSDQPVRIVAHSMGGLVARAALARDGTWERFRKRAGSRLVMLGTPNGGTYSIPMMLMARNKLMSHLAVLDFTMARREHQAIFSRFGGALAMLPAEDPTLFTAARWQTLHELDSERSDWGLPRDEDLARAQQFCVMMQTAPLDPERMFYVAGQAMTIAGIHVDQTRPGESKILFDRTHQGDGQVLWRTGIPGGIRAWYTPAAHGDLARYAPAFAAIQDLLELGRTNLLPSEPAALTRGLAKPEPIAREHAPVFPGEAELVLGGTSGPTKMAGRREMLPRASISVLNGDLSFASHAVLVGHYAGDTIAGTEEHVDRALSGRLRGRYDLGIYPGLIGSAEVVLDPKVKPPGAVIMGLGNIAELTPGRLREALVRGLTTYAAAASEALGPDAAPGKEQRLSISPVLIGSGEGGLGIDDTVSTLLHAVLETQRRLQRVNRPTFRRVQIVELVEQRAITIWHVLERLLQQPEFRAAFDLEPEVRTARGNRRRLALPNDRSWWRTVQITAKKQPGGTDYLHFVGIAGRARAEASMVADNRAIADLFVNQAIEGGAVDSEHASPARAMFELLWPNELKEANTDDTNLRMVLDEPAARYPWELMDDRRPWLIRGGGPDMAARKPPAARFGVLRQLVNENYRPASPSAAGGRRALVIGDPRGGTPARGFAPLPGARAEAAGVAKLLRSRGYEVTELIGDAITPDLVIRHLLADVWSIVHIAAHGVVEHGFIIPEGTRGPAQTGIVLAEGVVLGPSLFNQMPVAPDLVFVNCCHLARIAPDTEAVHRLERRPELAAGIAVQLIAMGTRAVAAAGWAVDDDAAQLFAEALYHQLLDGSPYGYAVRAAREHTYDAHPRSTTWGAYQCYGEPDWRLDPRSTRTAPEQSRRYAAAVEALVEVERIREMANVGIGRDPEIMAARLREVEHAVEPRGWLSRADLRAALGEAHAELGHLDEAIAHYEKALRLEQAQVPVRAIEQLANLRIRKAGQIPPTDEVARKAALVVIDHARADLESLTTLAGPTAERLSLQGSAWKRRAQRVEGEEREAALQRMSACYSEAADFARKAKLANAYYAHLMHGTVELIMLLRRNADAPRELCETFAMLCQEMQRAEGDPDDFWRAVALPDAQLCLAIAEKRLDVAKEAALVSAYLEIWGRAGSDLKLRSVIEQYRFIETMLENGAGPAGAARADVRDALARIRAQLETARGRGVDATHGSQV